MTRGTVGHPVGTVAWNKGLTKENDDRVLKYSVSNKGNCSFLGKTHSDETKQKLSAIASANNRGGRSKWYDVSGQRVQGTWERDIGQKLTELGVLWMKVRTSWRYTMDGKIRHYTPDFFLPNEEVYLEIKGYWWGDDKRKMDIVQQQYPEKKIIVIEKSEFIKILQGELVW